MLSRYAPHGQAIVYPLAGRTRRGWGAADAPIPGLISGVDGEHVSPVRRVRSVMLGARAGRALGSRGYSGISAGRDGGLADAAAASWPRGRDGGSIACSRTDTWSCESRAPSHTAGVMLTCYGAADTIDRAAWERTMADCRQADDVRAFGRWFTESAWSLLRRRGKVASGG